MSLPAGPEQAHPAHLPTPMWTSNFGTGALKITPAHDPNDFEIGRRHRLDRGQGHRRRRHHERSWRAPTRGWTASTAGKESSRILKHDGLAGKNGALQPRGGALLPLQDHDRAPALQAVVREGGAPGRDGHGRGAGGTDSSIIPDHWESSLFRMDEQHPGLVHLPADLVGPPHPGLVLPRSAARSWSPGRTRGCCHACGGGGPRPGNRRPGHLVLLGPLALFHPGLAGRTRRN